MNQLIQKDMSTQKKGTTQFAAQNVSIDVKNAFDTIKADTIDDKTGKEITAAALVERMVIAYAMPKNKRDEKLKEKYTDVLEEKIALESQITELKEELAKFTIDKEKCTVTYDGVEFFNPLIDNPGSSVFKDSPDLNPKLDKFRNHDIITDDDAIDFLANTIESQEQTITDLKEKQFELTGKQFICEFAPEVSELAKKCRHAIERDGYLKNTNDGNYPNKLANLATKNFLLQNYEKEAKK
jgi:hypothetical protein